MSHDKSHSRGTERQVSICRSGNGVVALCVATDEQPYFADDFVAQLQEAIAIINEDRTVRVVVVEGGNRYFCAGGSRDRLLADDPDAAVIRYVSAIPRLILSIAVPTIALMAGHAIGGGLALGLWCDIAVLAEESLYGANFMALGITPGMGSTSVIEEAVGASLAREMLFTGRLFKGRELRYAGAPLAHAIVPKEEIRDRAFAIAEEIADVPRQSLLLLKATLATRRRARLESVLPQENAMHSVVFTSNEIRKEICERYVVSGHSQDKATI
jgi:enoyl-CoA hydratase/carnithine racemase